MRKIIISLFTLAICLFSVNAFAAVFFDDFRLTSNDIAPVNESATLSLLGLGLVGLLFKKKRTHNRLY